MKDAGVYSSFKRPVDYQRVARPVVALSGEYPAGHIDPRHAHSRAQLLYASQGVMSIVTRTTAFVVPPDRAVWLPKGTEHRVHYPLPASLRTLYIDVPAVSRLPDRCRVIEVSVLLRALILEAVRLPTQYDMAGRAGRIMNLLIDEIASMPTAPLHAPLPQDERLGCVCRALIEDPVAHQRLDEVARAAGMSRRTLTRRFRRETGMSFVAWRQHLRLLEAVSLLATGKAVAQVAAQVGYRSPSSFTSMFRRTFGASPRHYMARATLAR
jgi:AraC-like DNA-binding protein/mannose-6-phosphate isomerase-like protein (cupin superfamily)